MQSLVNMTHRQGRGGEKKKSVLELLKSILELPPNSMNQSQRDKVERLKKTLDEDLEAGARIADESDAEQDSIRSRRPPPNANPAEPVTQFSKRGEAKTPNSKAKRTLSLLDDTMGAAGYGSGARRPFGQTIPNFTRVPEVSEVSAQSDNEGRRIMSNYSDSRGQCGFVLESDADAQANILFSDVEEPPLN